MPARTHRRLRMLFSGSVLYRLRAVDINFRISSRPGTGNLESIFSTVDKIPSMVASYPNQAAKAESTLLRSRTHNVDGSFGDGEYRIMHPRQAAQC